MPTRQGAAHDSFATYRSFVCAGDQPIVVTANTEKMWQGMCAVLGLDELTSDERFLTGQERLANRDALWPILETAFAQREATGVLEELVKAGVPCARINDVGEALNDPQVQARKMIVEVRGDGGRTMEMVGAPIGFDGPEPPQHSLPPRLGEHTEQVLGELGGLTEAQISKLIEDGVAFGNGAASLTVAKRAAQEA